MLVTALMVLLGHIVTNITSTEKTNIQNVIKKQEESARERALCQLTECF